MLRLNCPYCGLCDETEFSYHGEANLHRPAGEAGQEAFYEFVYLRKNPRGDHEELWQHTAGCRAFLKVRRNTQTHEVLGSAWPHDPVCEAPVREAPVCDSPAPDNPAPDNPTRDETAGPRS